MKTTEASRYHPALVTLHWALAALIVGALIFGRFVVAATPNADPAKISLLRAHMAGGMLIFALMAARLLVRLVTARPPEATTGHPALDRLAPIVHYGFYILVLLMAASGLTTAVVSGLNLIVFGGSGAPLPHDLGVYPPRIAHGLIAALLALLIVGHALAALYHQFVLGDGLFRRMAFGRRSR